MRQRMMLWVVLAGIVAGATGVAVVARGGGAAPERLPALALGSGATPAAAEAVPRAFPWPAEVRYEVRGALADLADRAPVWKAGGQLDAGRLRRLAGALGLRGTPVEHPDSWVVRDGGRELRVAREAGLPWFYTATALGDCAQSAPAAPDRPVTSTSGPSCTSTGPAGAGGQGSTAGAPSGTGATPATAVTASPAATSVPAEPSDDCPPPPCPPNTRCTPPPCAPPVETCPMPPCPPGTACTQVCRPVEPQRPADLPSEREARQIARRLLGDAGLDLAGAEVQVIDEVVAWYVNVSPAIGGLPVRGWDHSVVVGPAGVVQSASGWLAAPERGEEYPLAGTAAGLERLRAGRWSGLPGLAAPGLPERLVTPAPACEDCPPPTPVVRTVTGVRLGLLFAPVRERGGEALFVPIYLFALDGGEEVPVLAVADELLPPEPQPAAPEPTEPAPRPLPPEPQPTPSETLPHHEVPGASPGAPGVAPSGAEGGRPAP